MLALIETFFAAFMLWQPVKEEWSNSTRLQFSFLGKIAIAIYKNEDLVVIYGGKDNHRINELKKLITSKGWKVNHFEE